MTTLLGQVEAPAVTGTGGSGVGDGVEDEPGQVDRFAGERAAGVEPGEQQQVV